MRLWIIRSLKYSVNGVEKTIKRGISRLASLTSFKEKEADSKMLNDLSEVKTQVGQDHIQEKCLHLCTK